MGGIGSGNWYRYARKKSTVEESLTVAMEDLREHLFSDSAGVVTWTSGSGNKSSINYLVTWQGGTPIVTLQYRWGDTEEVRIPVPLQFGRGQWWFTCPLIVNGEACARRVGKLHLPRGAKYFGCRTCHKLTYRSSQMAHHAERLSARNVLLMNTDWPSRMA